MMTNLLRMNNRGGVKCCCCPFWTELHLQFRGNSPDHPNALQKHGGFIGQTVCGVFHSLKQRQRLPRAKSGDNARTNQLGQHAKV